MDANELLGSAGRSRETPIRRDAEGRWFHDGDPLQHPHLVRAFDRWIERADDGRYCLKNDINWAYFTLEGAPYFVRSVAVEGTEVRVFLSNDRDEVLDATTLRVGPEGALYCDVQGGTMVARFDRHAMFQLESLIGEDEKGATLKIGGNVVRPPVVSDPLALVAHSS